jgi:DNA-binding NtrC family response regulator
MKKGELKILLVEDDALTAQVNKRLLRPHGHVSVAKSIKDAHNLMSQNCFDIGFFDLNLYGELDGLKLLKLAKLNNLYSVVLSGETKKEILEQSFINGAKDFLSKPFDNEKLESVLKRFYNFKKHTYFEKLINESFITKSTFITEELYKLKNITFSKRPVFISGETGTGKRVVAHIIKDILECDNFLEINCSQYTDELFASEILGHTKGAFTGASKDKKGILEKADGGVVFLDEIHALSPKAQKTLLKAIDEQEFYPVGSDIKVKSNFRVISATCENIHELISRGDFRQDLYARISTFSVSLLPLRERSEDINLLFEYFLSKQPFRILINDEASRILKNYDWPQNTREIQDLVENWIVQGHRLITPDVLPTHIKNNINPTETLIPEYYLDLVEEMGLKEFLTVFKKEVINGMLKRHRGVVKHASKAMGTSYPNLTNFLKNNSNKTFMTRSRS